MTKRASSETTFLILTALAAGTRHGYAIIIDVEEISGRRLGAGTLYTALERLTREGLIEVDREEVVDSRLRRYYRLTALGGAQLAEEASRRRANADAAIARLRVNPTGPIATA